MDDSQDMLHAELDRLDEELARWELSDWALHEIERMECAAREARARLMHGGLMLLD